MAENLNTKYTSATQLKEMRLFYEGWQMLDANSPVTTDELQSIDNQIDIFK